VNFFQHEMGVALFLRHVRRPGYRLRSTAHALSIAIPDLDSTRANQRKLPIFQEDNVARVGQQGRDIGCDEVFTLTDSHNQRPSGRTTLALPWAMVTSTHAS